jgi:hypothetical protein
LFDGRTVKWFDGSRGFFIERRNKTSYDDIMAGTSRKQNRTKAASQQMDEVQPAINYGIDVSVLVQNMARSHTERIMRHQIALNTAEQLRKAKPS